MRRKCRLLQELFEIVELALENLQRRLGIVERELPFRQLNGQDRAGQLFEIRPAAEFHLFRQAMLDRPAYSLSPPDIPA